MVHAAQQILQSAVVDTIKKRHEVKYWEIADSIGVHVSHIQKVSKGIRLLSAEKFEQLCQHWHIDITDITQQLELDDMEYLRRKTLISVIRAKEVDLYELSRKTGISPLDLNQIQRNKRQPTEEEIREIGQVLNVDPLIVSEGLVAVVFEMIEKGLGLLHVEPSAIEAVMRFIEEEI